MHLLMCAPMLLIGVVLLVGGAGVGVLIPLVACVLMMALMMGSMSGHDQRGPGSER
jgi:hypothetical protein